MGVGLPFPGAAPPPVIVRTHVLAIQLQTNASTRHAQSSAKLPYPGIIRQVTIAQALPDSAGNWKLDLKITTAQIAGAAVEVPGRSIFDFQRSGTVSPDLTSDRDDPFVGIVNQAPTHLAVHIPVTEPNLFLTATSLPGSATLARWYITVSVDELIGGEDSSGAPPIIPRGTPEEPVCVRICDGAPPPKPPPPNGPPAPPPPPPPPGAGPDAAAEPLPPPCDIDPLTPLDAALLTCQVP